MSGRAVIERERRVFDDFFKIDEFLVSHEQIDGTISAGQKRLVFERGDVVAVLLLNVQMKSVVLVEQFRVAVLVGRRRDDRSIRTGSEKAAASTTKTSRSCSSRSTSCSIGLLKGQSKTRSL